MTICFVCCIANTLINGTQLVYSYYTGQPMLASTPILHLRTGGFYWGRVLLPSAHMVC